MIRQFRPKAFIEALTERGYARSVSAARKYVRRHPQGFYTDCDFEKALDWIENRERHLSQGDAVSCEDLYTEEYL